MLTKLAQVLNNPLKIRIEFYQNEKLAHALFDSLLRKVVESANSQLNELGKRGEKLEFD